MKLNLRTLLAAMVGLSLLALSNSASAAFPVAVGFSDLTANVARSYRKNLEPPKWFLVNPGNIKITYIWKPPREVAKYCHFFGTRKGAKACSITPRDRRLACIVFMPTNLSRSRLELFLRHENAHCYGWRHG